MKQLIVVITMLGAFMILGSNAMAHCWDCGSTDASGDGRRPWFCGDDKQKKSIFNDGFIIFPGAEIGMGSGALTGSLGVNLGYKYKKFVVGTSIRGQIVNIDRVNYTFIPYTINISGLSYSVVPETTNDQNDKKLEGWAIGFAMGPKLTFSRLVEKDPATDTEEEFLVISIGAGF